MTQPEMQYRVNAQLCAVERTTLLASQRPMTAPALPYSVPGFKKEIRILRSPSRAPKSKKGTFFYRNLP